MIVNGAYIALGSFGRIGDCGEMLRHGSPRWVLWLFGAVTLPAGLWLWHGLDKPAGNLQFTLVAVVCLIAVVVAELIWSLVL